MEFVWILKKGWSRETVLKPGVNKTNSTLRWAEAVYPINGESGLIEVDLTLCKSVVKT